LCDLAGTGPSRHEQFQDAVRSYQQDWRAFFLPRAFAKQRLAVSDLDAIPKFTMPYEQLGAVSRRVLISLLGLLAFAGLVSVLILPLTQKRAGIRRDFAA
jgi:hypothetical protein